MNRRIVKIVSWLLAMALVCTSVPISASAAKKVKLNKKSVTLKVGKTVKLKLKNNKKKVSWSSANKKIATVSKSGLVKAKKKGKTKITAKVKKKKYVCKITVTAKSTSTNPTENPDNNGTASEQPEPTSGSGETSTPGGNATPVPGGDKTPVPGGNETPVPGGNTTPVPGGNATPVPGGNATPVPGGNQTPIPGGNQTPIPGGDATPTPTPGGNTTPTPGENVPLPAGSTTFTLGSRNLAIGMSKADVYKVLGSSNEQEIRDTGKSPQGFDVIAYNTNDYAEYLLIYLKEDKVTGICGIGQSMSFDDAAAGAYGTALDAQWKNSADYKTDAGKKVSTARSKDISASETVYAFYDALGDNKIYCIQVFDPTKIKKADDDMIFGTTHNLTYDAAVTSSIATETGKMLNAIRAYYGKTAFRLNSKIASCAQAYSNQAAQNGASKMASRGDELFDSLDALGVFAGNCGEIVYTSAADAISAVNSIMGMEDVHTDLVGEDAESWRYAGVGMAATSNNTYMTIDYVDITNWKP